MNTVQRFLHIAKPVKWRDRMIDNALGSRFIQSKEKVISIEPDGEEEVFGLTTSTGNYVVWGIASSNSGQMQQRPAPRGGGILRDEWWQYYTAAPRIEWRGIWADTAQKTKEASDYSVFQCWGRSTFGQAVLLDQIRGKWEAPELLLRARTFWTKHRGVDGMGALRSLNIEDKVSGTGLIQTLRREGIPVRGIQRSTDKITRAMDVAPSIEAGHVMLPADAPWLADWLDEAASFPQGAHDDQLDPMLDAVSAIIGLRKGGYTLDQMRAAWA